MTDAAGVVRSDATRLLTGLRVIDSIFAVRGWCRILSLCDPVGLTAGLGYPVEGLEDTDATLRKGAVRIGWRAAGDWATRIAVRLENLTYLRDFRGGDVPMGVVRSWLRLIAWDFLTVLWVVTELPAQRFIPASGRPVLTSVWGDLNFNSESTGVTEVPLSTRRSPFLRPRLAPH